MAAFQDRLREVGGEESQPDETCHIGTFHFLPLGDLPEAHTSPTHEFFLHRMGLDDQLDEAGIEICFPPGRIFAIDEHFHLDSPPLEMGRDGEDQMRLFSGSLVRRRRGFLISLQDGGNAAGKEMNIDLPGMDLNASDERKEKTPNFGLRKAKEILRQRVGQFQESFLISG